MPGNRVREARNVGFKLLIFNIVMAVYATHLLFTATAALLRQQLFIFRDLWAWLNSALEGPPAAHRLGEQLPMPLVW